jgi:hypothetical protein
MMADRIPSVSVHKYGKHREGRCAASGKARDRGVLASTVRKRNEVGVDAAALECYRICELKHLDIFRQGESLHA